MCSCSQVEEGLEQATYNERHGTDFDLIPSAELFYEDKVRCQDKHASATRCNGH